MITRAIESDTVASMTGIGSVGKNAFKGISSKAVFKCPSKQLKATYKKLFTTAGAPKKASYK